MPPELTNAPLFPFAVLFGVLGILVVIAALYSVIELKSPHPDFRMPV